MKKKKDKDSYESKLDSIINPEGKKVAIPIFTYEMMLSMSTGPQKSIIESTCQVNLFLAGQGSGKTQTMGYLSAFFATNFPKMEGIIAANTYLQLSDSTLNRIWACWKELGYSEYNPKTGKGHYVNSKKPPEGWLNKTIDDYDHKIFWCNGAIIYTGSLDNYQAHDGKQVGWILLDETKDTKVEALTEVLIPRARQIGLYIDAEGRIVDHETANTFNPVYLFTTPAKVSWLNDYFNLYAYEKEIMSLIFQEKEYFFRETMKDRYVSISSTYHNQHISKGYIDKQKNLIPPALHAMNIYGCPFSRSGGEFYKEFDRSRHVGKCQYNPTLPLHISFDFNVSPYVTLCIWQIDGKKAYQIGEICAKYPNNTTKGACRLFRNIYPAHDSGLLVYGDPSGKARDTRLEASWNDFDIIMSELRDYKPQLRVPALAPAVVGRGQFVNMIFHNQYQGISILIDDTCTHSILDYTMLKEASDGTKLKQKAKNKDTGVTEELYGHTSDANDYFLCEAFRQELNHYKTGGVERRETVLGKFKKLFNR